jgi:hypothetical protein
MLYCMELYDILFFDWFLLCHSNFFPHFYPELKGIVGPHVFSYNKRTHILHFLLYIPPCAALSYRRIAGMFFATFLHLPLDKQEYLW